MSKTNPRQKSTTTPHDIYFMSGDHAEAVEFWKEALKLDPENEAIKKKVTHRTYFFE